MINSSTLPPPIIYLNINHLQIIIFLHRIHLSDKSPLLHKKARPRPYCPGLAYIYKTYLLHINAAAVVDIDDSADRLVVGDAVDRVPQTLVLGVNHDIIDSAGGVSG